MELTDSMLQLSELFPDAPLSHISHILSISNNDFSEAMDQMFNYELIKDEISASIEKAKGEPRGIEKNSGEEQRWVVLNDSSNTKEVSSLSKKSKKKEKVRKNSGKSEKSNSAQGQHALNTDQSPHAFDNSSGLGSSEPAEIVGPLSLMMESIKLEDLVTKLEIQEEVMNLLEIGSSSTDLTTWYLVENDYSKLDTIYDLLLNFNPHLSQDKQPREHIDDVSIDTLIIRHSSKFDGFSISDIVKKGNGNHAGADQIWKELDHLITLNPGMRVPKKLYILAMGWFSKDVDKVLNLIVGLHHEFPETKENYCKSYQLLQHDRPHFGNESTVISGNPPSNSRMTDSTKGTRNTAISINDYTTPLYSKSLNANDLYVRCQKLKESRNNTRDNRLKSYYSQNISDVKSNIWDLHQRSQRDLANEKLAEARKSWQIDLHGLNVDDAIYALDIIAAEWWDTEMQQRSLNNTKFQITTVVHVNPLNVITGRGLHSEGGIAKIKKAATTYLRRNNFKFEDNTSTLTIYGKKRK